MFAVLLVSNFRLQAVLRFRSEARTQPWALIDEQEMKAGVLERNELAAKAQITPGLSAAQARTRCPHLKLISHSPAQEDCAQAALLELAATLAPQVENTAPGYCTINLTTARAPDFLQLAERALQQLAALQLCGHFGIAPNPDLALLAARQATDAQPVCLVEKPAAFLAALPLSVLEPAPELGRVLRDWGVHTVGQLTALPRGELVDRLGLAAAQLWERAAGQTARPLRVLIPSEDFLEMQDLEHEVETVKPLLFLLRRFLAQLVQRLENAYRVAAQMSLTLTLAEGEPHQREFTIPAPTAELEVLFRILHTHLDGLHLPHAVAGLRLHIVPTRPERLQHQLFDNPLRDPNRFGETLGRLAALVGAENVGVVQLADSHRPDSFHLVAPRFHELKEAPAEEAAPQLGLALRRFRPPLPAAVQLSHYVPVRVEAAGIRGKIEDVRGPYRVSGNWWEPTQWAREEWDIALQNGALYRLAKHNGRWLLEGCYAEARR